MDKLSRRSFLRTRLALPASATALSGTSELDPSEPAEGTSRRTFLEGTAGAAAGAAVILAAPKVASIAGGGSGGRVPEPKAIVTEATGPAPAEPVTAVVHNADRNEVTVMSGQQETTYKDPVLVKRLLDAAR